MAEFLQTTEARIILLASALVGLICVGIYVIDRIRSWTRDPPAGANKMMSNFREMHLKGELSEKEFRTIKGMLAEDLQDELKDRSKDS